MITKNGNTLSNDDKKLHEQLLQFQRLGLKEVLYKGFTIPLNGIREKLPNDTHKELSNNNSLNCETIVSENNSAAKITQATVRRRKPKETQELKEEIEKLQKQGKTYQEIAEIKGISKPYVGKLLSKNNTK